MIAVFLIPPYLLLCGYLFFRLDGWIACLAQQAVGAALWWALAAILLVLALSPLVAMLLPARSPVKPAFAHLGNYFLGVLLYTLLIVGAADLGRLLLKLLLKDRAPHGDKAHAAVGFVCLLLISAVCIAGVIRANRIRVVSYEVTVHKPGGVFGRELKIALCADLHLGYNMGARRTRQMVRRLNAQNPDMVLIAGDIFDNDYDAMYHPEELIAILRDIKAPYGVYAVYGNHDIAEKALSGFTFGPAEGKASDPRMDAFLEKANIRLLREEHITVADSVTIAGRADPGRPGRGVSIRKTPAELLSDVDKSKPVIVLDHQPGELAQLAAAGADMDLSGHTHNGQLFPGTLIVRRFWENPCGYLNKDGMHSIVTAGVGLYGPNLRVGAPPEVCAVTVRFTAP